MVTGLLKKIFGSRNERLVKQYQAMEDAMAKLSSTGDYISSWASTLAANWGNTSSNSNN